MKLWGGRFEKATEGIVDDFHSSIAFDQKLYAQDIEGSIAHATMLGEQGIISVEDADVIVSGLRAIKSDIEAGRVAFSVEAEDIHMNIETLLIERIGEAGKRLHTGRSRNDQVALDMRMYMKQACGETATLLRALVALLLDIAQANLETVMPGYTHLQRAQPITLAHHLSAYASMFLRDIERMEQARARADEMPLGSGALAGTTYPLNRERVAEQLGFSRITRNSLDGVSDRDFCCDYVYACSLVMMHMSRLCEELILWSSGEFAFIEMDDGYATGSSIMPQKKNPDVAELIRGKTGRVYGDLIALLSMLKSLPLAYNKDMQEDKESFFDARDTAVKCLAVMHGMLATVSFRKDNMRRAAALGFANATDAADYLVKHGMPFREAHEVIGKLVAHCIREGKAIEDISLAVLQGDFSPLFGEDVYTAISLETCVRDRRLPGGPAPEAVSRAIAEMRVTLERASSFCASPFSVEKTEHKTLLS